MTKEQIAKKFNCTIEQLNAQYRENYLSLLSDQIMMERTGKKTYRGYTLESIKKAVETYKALSES